MDARACEAFQFRGSANAAPAGFKFRNLEYLTNRKTAPKKTRYTDSYTCTVIHAVSASLSGASTSDLPNYYRRPGKLSNRSEEAQLGAKVIRRTRREREGGGTRE